MRTMTIWKASFSLCPLYEDNVFYEILAEELSRRDMDYPEITPENYDEIVGRMDRYMTEFERCGVLNLVLDD